MNKSKIIHDNIHGYMKFEPLCLQIIDTPEFQRLRNLKQLGATYFVFPCANHTRFEHSLGVAYLTGIMLNNIKNNQPELGLDNRTILLVKIAGLMHDIGHGCFSHFFDKMLLKGCKSKYKYHENRSILILENMIKKYSIDIKEKEVKFINNIINSTDKNTEWIYQIVANAINSLDTDKFDYLQRDTKSIGLPYSIDNSRIISQARVIDNCICYPDKEIITIYEIFHTRYLLHKQIYTHPVIQQIEYMLLDAIRLADDVLDISDSINDMEKFIKIDDNLIDYIYYSNDPKLKNSKDLINRIKNRDLYSFICEKIYDKNNILKEIEFDDFIKLDTNFQDKVKIDEIIIHYSCIGYTGNNNNPVDNISFYNINNPYKILKYKKDDVSKLLPVAFNENIIRIFSKNKNNNDYIKKCFDLIIDKYNY